MAKKVKTTKKVTVQPPRKLKIPEYRSFRLSKRIKPPLTQKIPSTWHLLVETKRQLLAHKKLFLGILSVYAVLTLFFVWAGGSLVNTTELKTTLNDTLGTTDNNLITNLTLFSLLLGNAASRGTDLSNTFQTFIMIITSMAIIWALRQTSDTAQKRLTVREAFYRGSAQLIPFLLVLLVIALQLIPLLIASFLYTTVTATGLIITPVEQAIWLLFFITCALLTLYMISSSIFALYIVTLPNMTPMKALKSARQVVLHRRQMIMRKIFLAFVVIFVLFAAMVLLSIYFIPQLTEVIFFGGSFLAIPIGIGFVYKLYRSLL